MHADTADLVRNLLVIVPGFYAIGSLLVAIRLYVIYYRDYLKKPRSNVGSSGYAFLCVLTSQFILISTLVYGIATTIGDPFNPRTILYGLGIFLSIAGMRFLVYAERRRIYNPDLDTWKTPKDNR